MLIHGDVELQSRIIPAPGCSVPISACSCSMALLPSALMEQHIPAIPLPGALSVLGSVSLTSPHVPLCSHPAAGRVLLAAAWAMPGTCWAGSASCAAAGRGTWAASSTLAESTALPQPGGQQDTRGLKGWQEKMLLFSWTRPTLHPQSLWLASADSCISSFSRSWADVKCLIPYNPCP